MKKITTITVLILIGLAFYPDTGKTDTAGGVEFELIIRQKPELVDKFYEVRRDTVRIPADGKLSTFLVNFTLEINITGIDTTFVDFDCHLVTLGPKSYNTARRFRIEYNLAARLENIPGKNGSVYQLLISPRQQIDIDATFCPFNPSSPDDFQTDPTANFDLSYVKNSLADYNWNIVRDYLEKEYIRFRNAFDLNPTGKIHYFLCPCPVTTIRWDKRFGYAISPGSSSIYALYTQDFVSCDAILTNMLRLLGLWGYAPPFVVEGLAGYFEFQPYKMKKLVSEDHIPRISEILRTSGYYAADPETAELTAASFMRFLADSHGISKVRQLYDKADDLNILTVMEKIFEQPLDSLEVRWRNYVDTVSITREMFAHYAARASVLHRNNEQLEYLTEMGKYDKELNDSLETTYLLSMAQYHQGSFYNAIDGFSRLIEYDTANTIYPLILGNLHMAVGQYDAARRSFERVYQLDSTYATARLLQAEIHAIQGDTATALTLAEEYLGLETTTPGKIEFLLFLGKLKNAPGAFHDSAAAERYLADALYWSTDMINKAPDDPAYKMRAGLAALELGDLADAEQYLEFAHFTERRAIYRGRIIPAMGKLYDLAGKRELALEYYGEGLNSQIAIYCKDLCKKYIDRPYTR